MTIAASLWRRLIGALINIHRPEQARAMGDQLAWRASPRLMPGEPLGHQARAAQRVGPGRGEARLPTGGGAPSPATFGIISKLSAARGRDHRAIHVYRRAVMILPANASYHWNLALAHC